MRLEASFLATVSWCGMQLGKTTLCSQPNVLELSVKARVFWLSPFSLKTSKMTMLVGSEKVILFILTPCLLALVNSRIQSLRSSLDAVSTGWGPKDFVLAS